MKRLRLAEQTRTIAPLLLLGARNGAQALSAANPANQGHDKRPGKNGADVARSERRLFRALKTVIVERDWTDLELADVVQQLERQLQRPPLQEEIERLAKPLTLVDGDPALELSNEDYDRLVAYCDAASWAPLISEDAADMLDLLASAETVD